MLSSKEIHSSPPKIVIKKIKGADNISVCGEHLIIAYHPKPFKFLLHSLLGMNSPSAVMQYNLKDGVYQRIYYDSGRTISGSSTALIYKDSLYISQVFGNYLMKVDWRS